MGVLVIIFLLNYAQLSLQIRGGETENSSQPSTPVMQTQEKKCKAMQLWADAETEQGGEGEGGTVNTDYRLGSTQRLVNI